MKPASPPGQRFPLAEAMKDALWSVVSWWPYALVAALLAGTWYVAGPGGLAVTAVAATFLGVAVFVGSLSESRRSGILAGLAAALPVALFFLWLLK